MSKIVDINTSPSKISDKELMERHKKREENIFYLYDLMAHRANTNDEMANYLFSIISDLNYREEVMKRPIMHSWYPLLCILKHSDDQIIEDLKGVVRDNWTMDEKEDLILYLNKEGSYSNFANSI